MVEEIIITKKIAKHGKQAVIIIPAFLCEQLSPGTLTEITFRIIERRKEEL